MGWDYGDRMRSYATQTGTSEPSVYAHYLYDAGGNRVKKVVRKSSGNTEVTIYIDGGMEYLYELDGSTKVQEMNELHVMDGRSRIARVREVLLSSWTGAAPVGVLYNLEDHLGNACFSLTAMGGNYSREEYFPFGETSFRDFGKERYRFCGKERDEESGFYYYGARYYAPWCCRFVSVDPLAGDYPFYTPFQYAGNKCINAIDFDGLETNPGQDTGIQSTDLSIIEGNPVQQGLNSASLEISSNSLASDEKPKAESGKAINLAIVFGGTKDQPAIMKGFDHSGNKNWKVIGATNMVDAKNQVEEQFSTMEIHNLLIVDHGPLTAAKPTMMVFGEVSHFEYETAVVNGGSFHESDRPNADANQWAAKSLFEKVEADGNIIFNVCFLGEPNGSGKYFAQTIYDSIKNENGIGPTIYMSRDVIKLTRKLYDMEDRKYSVQLSLNVESVPTRFLDELGAKPRTLTGKDDWLFGWISYGSSGLRVLNDPQRVPAIFGTGAPFRFVPLSN
jgi:RHS repeat-associated protein